MINLLSNDVNRFDYFLFPIHYIWIAPIQTAIISYLLYKEVHLAAVGGILTLLLFIPIHGKCIVTFKIYFPRIDDLPFITTLQATAES